MRWLAAALVLTSCVRGLASGECVTKCGLRAESNCAELQRAETSVIREFSKVGEWTEGQICAALGGWQVTIHEIRATDKNACKGYGPSWLLGYISGEPFCIAGITHDDMHVIELLDDKWHSNPLAHELVHVLDLKYSGRAGHCRWYERGVLAAIKRVTGRDDGSAPEKECK